jgi:CheY-like chemotaxis protein
LKRILVADDEKNILLVIRVCLEKAGYEVITASDGLTALEKIQNEKPDLILLDILMPKMNGFLVFEALKDDPGTSSIPVVFITAKSEEKDIQKGCQLGAADYLIKPIKQEVLLNTIRKILKEEE